MTIGADETAPVLVSAPHATAPRLTVSPTTSADLRIDMLRAYPGECRTFRQYVRVLRRNTRAHVRSRATVERIGSNRCSLRKPW